MTPRPTKIETLEDVKIWIADHDGRIDQLWSDQHRWNEKAEHKIGQLDNRVNSLERRVMWFSGAAAAIGAFAGVFLQNIL